MTSRDPALQELLDRAAIHDLLIRYARSVDEKDIAAVQACFTPEASYKGSLGEGPAAAVLSTLGERWSRYKQTIHFLASPLIEIDGARAESDSRALVYHRYESEGEERDFVVSVRYIDELRRHDGDAWLIQQRVATVEWQRVDTVILPTDFP